MPIKSLLPPVIFAIANGAYEGSSAAFHANEKSTAYSGRTAIIAMNAIASPAEISFSAASAPQLSRKAAPNMATP